MNEVSPRPAVVLKGDHDLDRIAYYWDHHVHDLEIATYPPGTPEFFQQLEDYRYDKLRYLPERVNFSGHRGKSLLEVGCGAGIDLVRFARAGALVTGVDISRTAIELARQNFANHGLRADLMVMNGEALTFQENRFDVVYAHGVLQYTADARKMIGELHRVLKPGGQAILMFYNKVSWLNLMTKLTGVPLEHQDAPVLRKISIRDFRRLLKPFNSIQIIPERFPVRTKLHSGWKARAYNDVFIRIFNLMPRAFVRPFGWHLMAFATK
jgi:ubiquinone/menaquinone biosynthesis C-methylase UbiE